MWRAGIGSPGRLALETSGRPARGERVSVAFHCGSLTGRSRQKELV